MDVLLTGASGTVAAAIREHLDHARETIGYEPLDSGDDGRDESN